MYKHNFKFEWMQLQRDRWVIILLMVFVALCFFAVSNGSKKVTVRENEILKSESIVADYDKQSKNIIDSLNAGYDMDVSPWSSPKRLSVVGNRGARVAAMPPAPLAFIATGQSDLFSHAVKPTLTSESYMLSFTEMSNPVQLLFGSFDLAFVCIYLLPLLVLGFSYNLLSSEKEQGSLRLMLAQPVSLYQWLLSKLALRFIIMTGIVWISLLAAMLVNGVSMAGEVLMIASLLLVVSIYILFWFIVALVVNAFGKSSGLNAVMIISIWVGLVMLLPAILSQAGNSLYPIPSRINLINEMRMSQAEANAKADTILQSFYRDHPELARPTDGENSYSYYLKFFASQNVVKSEVTPVLNEYTGKLKAQQNWVSTLRFLSPSLIVQNVFNDLAGTSTQHYESYREQVVRFAEEWRSYFLPRMFADQEMASADFEKLPVFNFNYDEVKTHYAGDLFGLLLFVTAGLFLSAWVYQRYAKEVLLG